MDLLLGQDEKVEIQKKSPGANEWKSELEKMRNMHKKR